MENAEQIREREFDESWKKVLEKYFWPFLEFYFPKIAAQIDQQQGYTFLDQELSAITRKAESHKRRLDKLAKVYLKDQQEVWLLIHVEIQSYRDQDFALRMMQYHYRIYDLYAKPVASIAILADADNRFRPDSFETRAFGETYLRFQFKTAKIIDWQGKEAELATDPNPFAVMTLASLKTHESDHQTRADLKFNLTKMLYERGYSGEMILALYEFLDGIMVLPETMERSIWIRSINMRRNPKCRTLLLPRESVSKKASKKAKSRPQLRCLKKIWMWL